MSVAPLHRTASSPHRGSIEVATLIALYAVYELVRGQGHATVAAARVHTDWIVGLERHLHVFGERAVQNAADAVPGLPTLLGVAYIVLHFAGTTAFLVWLYRHHRHHFARVRNTMIAATGMALMLYVIVATGNHFFFDAAAGGVAIGAGYLIASWIESARREPQRRPARGSA